ncbi:Fc.00g103610.m01.CDS01 [Cosmosporella sp. VM-42]
MDYTDSDNANKAFRLVAHAKMPVLHAYTQTLASLEREVAECQIQDREDNDQTEQSQPPSKVASSSTTDDQAHPDLIRLENGGDAHFLGVSSGMHMARSVLESAQRNNANFESRPNGDNRPHGENTSSPSHTLQSRLPHRLSQTALPSQETAMNLLEVFFGQYQVQYPILMEDEFTAVVANRYQRAGVGVHREDPWTEFMLNMTFASSLVCLSQENREALGLAQGFSSNAMAEFSTIMQIKGVRTLQCLLLLLLYSVLSSSSAPIWYISGLCMRMCVDLGLHSERTISVSGKGEATEDEIDTKRRLFWVTYTFDRTLSIMLGRPFTLDDATIDVKFPEHSLPTGKRSQILHWLKLQQLQSEIVSRLYIIRDETSHPQCNLSTWIAEMTQQLATWNDETLSLTESTGPNIDWWRYWYQNALLILHRPSPTNSRPHSQNLLTCYGAAKSLIQLSFIRVNRGLTDFTWLELHYQVMSGITLLFLVWDSPEARATAKAEWITFKSCLAQWEFVLTRLTDRWDRMARPKEVLVKLADVTVEIIEKGMMKSTGGTNEGQRQRRAKDEDRRRSIMEQLGSPGNSSGGQTAIHNQEIPDLSQSANAGETLGNRNDFYKHFPNSNNTSTLQDLPVELFDAPTMESQTNQHIPQLSWQDLQPPPQHQGFEGVGSSLTTDVSAMLADEVWPSLGQYDDTGVLGSFGLFEYFPMSMTGTEDFDDSGTGAGVRTDGIITDSVLNFRENWEDGTACPENGNM